MSENATINFIFQGVDKFSGVSRTVGQNVQSLGTTVKETSGRFDSLKNSMSMAAGMMIRDLANSLTGSLSDSMKLGAQVTTLKTSFDRLVETTGATNLSLKSLKEAVKGTISDVSLLTAANTSLSLGIPADRLNELYAAAMKLGPALGLTTTQAVDSLSTGIGRCSKLVLDNLGIVFDADVAYVKFAASIDKNASELTDSEKKMAWQSYAMSEVTRRAEELGDTMSDAQLQQERWNAQIMNTKTNLGNALGPLSGFVGAMQPLLPMMSMMAAQLIPSMIKGLITMIAQYGFAGTVTHGLAAAQAVLNAVMNANPIFLVITLIGGLIAILVTAYQTCEPFRNAVNAVGGALLNFFKPAIEAVKGALEWLWKNILEPIANFLKLLLVAAIQYLIDQINRWKGVIDAVKGALDWLWKNVLEPIANFLKVLFVAAVQFIIDKINQWKGIIDAIKGALEWLWKHIFEPIANFLKGAFTTAWNIALGPINAFKGLIDGLIGVGKKVGDFFGGIVDGLKKLCFKHASPMIRVFNKELKESIALSGQMTQKLGGLSAGLQGVAKIPAINYTSAYGVAPAIPASMTQPQIREVTVNQYGWNVASGYDARAAAEEAYREFLRKLGNKY